MSYMNRMMVQSHSHTATLAKVSSYRGNFLSRAPCTEVLSNCLIRATLLTSSPNLLSDVEHTTQHKSIWNWNNSWGLETVLHEGIFKAGGRTVRITLDTITSYRPKNQNHGTYQEIATKPLENWYQQNSQIQGQYKRVSWRFVCVWNSFGQ